MIDSKLVDSATLMELVSSLTDADFKKYPQLNRKAVTAAVQKLVKSS